MVTLAFSLVKHWRWKFLEHVLPTQVSPRISSHPKVRFALLSGRGLWSSIVARSNPRGCSANVPFQPCWYCAADVALYYLEVSGPPRCSARCHRRCCLSGWSQLDNYGHAGVSLVPLSARALGHGMLATLSGQSPPGWLSISRCMQSRTVRGTSSHLREFPFARDVGDQSVSGILYRSTEQLLSNVTRECAHIHVWNED